MASEPRPPRLAVLIDADNASAKTADGLFAEIAGIGEAVVRWIYGDFSSARSKAWADVLVKHAIVPQQRFANTIGKNASDITLVIDAMDLLHSGLYDGFCLVSSDSDFTRLASRLREQGVAVYGFGKQTTPPSFRQACTRFIYTENLVAEPTKLPAKAKAPNGLRALEATIARIVAETDSDSGWIALSEVGKRLSSLSPDFDARTFGYKKLSDLARALSSIEVKSDGGRLLIRVVAPAGRNAKANPD